MIYDKFSGIGGVSKLTEGVGGTCLVERIRSQIRNTLQQFPTVKSVVISVDGKTEGVLEP